MRENIKEWIKAAVFAVVIAIIVIQFVRPTVVSGISMEPNFQDEDYLIVSKQAYNFGEFERGDVVVFQSSLPDKKGGEKLLIKRIVGLPGETVAVKDGQVYIDGEKLSENCTKDGWTSGEVDSFTIPKGEVFCLGDNRLRSTDSRDPRVGCVDKEQITGKVVFRVYPFNEFGKIGRLL